MSIAYMLEDWYASKRDMAYQKPQLVSITTGTILKFLGVLFAIWVVWMIRDIVLLVFTSLLLAGVMYPFVRAAAARKVPKSLAVIIFYVIFFGMLALAFALLIPAIVTEAKQFAATHEVSQGWMTDGIDGLKQLTQQYGLGGSIQGSLSGLQDQASKGITSLFGTLGDVFGGIAGVLVVLVLALYIIVEESAVKTLFQNIIPNEHQEFAGQTVWLMIDKLGGWLRGQLLLSLIMGMLYFVVFTVIGVPYALLLALLGGLLEFIPYLGPIIAAIPALLLALSVSPGTAIATLVGILIAQQLENNLIVPKVMQKAVGLNPLVSIIAFMIGGKLFGIGGAIFAIPVATATMVALQEIVKFRSRTR